MKHCCLDNTETNFSEYNTKEEGEKYFNKTKLSDILYTRCASDLLSEHAPCSLLGQSDDNIHAEGSCNISGILSKFELNANRLALRLQLEILS